MPTQSLDGIFIAELMSVEDKRSTQIDIKRIDHILIGQNTPNFQKHASPELARASFSVIYDKNKTLDVVAKKYSSLSCYVCLKSNEWKQSYRAQLLGPRSNCFD